MNTRWIKALFVVAGLYSGILGIVFVFFSAAVFSAYNVEPPNHLAYVQFPSLLMLVFSAMFFSIASDPVRHKDLILYGCGLKASFCIVAFWYMLTDGIPSMWVPWAWADLVFLVLFAIACVSLGKVADHHA